MNPSCNLGDGRVGFANLGDPPFGGDAMRAALAELSAAGLPRGSASFTTREIEVYKPDSEAAQLASAGISMPSASARSEKMWIEVHDVTAAAYGWRLRRCWYYWSCATYDHPLPLAVAARLNADCGSVVRVDGYAGGRSPREDVDSYHVDTPAGLAALVAALKQEHDRRAAERETRR